MIAALQTRLRQNQLLSGSAILLLSTTIVNAGNYAFNLVLGRWLGPVAFADLSLIVTLMLIVTFVTVTFQMSAAKFTASYVASQQIDNIANLRAWMGRLAWLGGILGGAIIAFGASLWQSFFNTASAWPFIILGVGLPFYFAQGVDRGVLQGDTQFGRLSLSYQAEMWARLALGLIFVAVGWSVNGAVGAITLSFMATWLVARTVKNRLTTGTTFSATERQAVATFTLPVIVTQIGQILINNSDILIVKRYFSAEEAGLYAALALIGRVVFFATWSVVTTLFPIVAQRHAAGQRHRHLLWAGIGIVAAISAIIVAMTIWQPELIVGVLFGEAYLAIAPELWLYAIATTLFAVANVIVNYRLSADRVAGTYFATAAGIVQVILLITFHDSIRQIVLLQIGLMSVLIAILLLWDGTLAYRERRASA